MEIFPALVLSGDKYWRGFAVQAFEGLSYDHACCGCLYNLCLCNGCRVEVIPGRAAGVAAPFPRLPLPSRAEQIAPYSKQRGPVG